MTSTTAPGRVSRAQREIEVAGLVRDGHSREDIAVQLGLTEDYVGGIIRRLGLDQDRSAPTPIVPADGELTGVIEHLPDLPGHFAEMFRALKPGGVFRIGGPNGDSAIRKFVEGDSAWFSDFPDKAVAVIKAHGK